jgi:transcriptional regulator with XRE-family HTH domain
MSQIAQSPAWSLIRLARRRAGLTQEELADRAGIDSSQITKFEEARELPDLLTLDHLIKLCGLELRYVLDKPDEHRQDALAASLSRSLEDRFNINKNAVKFALEIQRNNDAK